MIRDPEKRRAYFRARYQRKRQEILETQHAYWRRVRNDPKRHEAYLKTKRRAFRRYYAKHRKTKAYLERKARHNRAYRRRNRDKARASSRQTYLKTVADPRKKTAYLERHRRGRQRNRFKWNEMRRERTFRFSQRKDTAEMEAFESGLSIITRRDLAEEPLFVFELDGVRTLER